MEVGRNNAATLKGEKEQQFVWLEKKYCFRKNLREHPHIRKHEIEYFSLLLSLDLWGKGTRMLV